MRNFKGPQDEINHRRSKALHILNSRRLILDKGAVDDVEKTRIEWARPDGVVEVNPGKKATPDDQRTDFAGQLQMLQEAKNEIENFGPNPALIGQGIEGSSGRAINLLQQAGIAELGPYIIAYRTWKMRVYRAIWQIVSRYWTSERWIRVTDDEGLAQFIQINGLTTDQYGQPAIANYLGSLDVDIIIDEGPDNVNMMADSYDTLLALVRGGQQIPANVLIELAPLQNSVKQKLLKQMEAAQKIRCRRRPSRLRSQEKAAKVDETQIKDGEEHRAGEETRFRCGDRCRLAWIGCGVRCQPGGGRSRFWRSSGVRPARAGRTPASPTWGCLRAGSWRGFTKSGSAGGGAARHYRSPA